ncbi:spondin-1-like isoform X2 [Lycorma delicatula]|uniref:spondin-1-like isoform X2 n=1 Tax=Lycorma delicatula TaxID=130591 RepID=UPI003F512030
MRGGVQLTIATAALLITSFCTTNATRCDRTPEGFIAPKSVGDNRFVLTVSGNPEKYSPNELYTISLKGIRDPLSSHIPKFIGFTLVVETLAPPWMSPREVEARPVGTLQLYGDALTKFSDNCPNMVTHTSVLPKAEVTVLWIAPPPGSGCVTIRATVVEYRDVWFQDDGPLSYKLCENVQDNFDNQPVVVRDCCACNEAKYEVTFEGLWSRHTHPKDFPSNSWLTRFSDVIGASHTTNYSFWEYGGYASEGLRQVATTGATRLLESELKDESQNIRTIIKARGISYPNVTGKTFAVFRVDKKHHLMSLVSMLDPSPDWIVGVSKLELCLENCTWIENKVLNLYPWDAGIHSGMTYISPEQPTVPQERIRKINSSYPNDNRSPFYDPTGEEMKPLARLYLNRQRTYERSCSESGEATEDEDACEISRQWSEWSACIPTENCGSGFQTRQREYKEPEKAGTLLCTEQVTQRRNCTTPESTCGPYRGNLNSVNPECEQAEWGEWSSCSAVCGRGNKVRTRIFKEQWEKECLFSEFQETRECEGSQTDCTPTYEEAALKDSEFCPWSHWSVCMPGCGKGKQTRNRLPLENNGMDPCNGLKTTEEVECDNNRSCEIDTEQAPVCQLPKDVGPCRGYTKRWFFDMLTQYCQEFIYTGCRGNRNNFKTQRECEQICGKFRAELIANRTARLKQYGVSLSGAISYNVQLQDTNCEVETATKFPSESQVRDTTENTDNSENIPLGDKCEYTRWGRWSECSKKCGRGEKKRYRTVKVKPRSGEKCEEIEDTKRCRGKQCGDKELCRYTAWSYWSPCSATCGDGATRQRTRNLNTGKHFNIEICTERIDKEHCHVLPCN